MTKVDQADWIKKLNDTLDGIRPHLAVDGGDVEVVELTDDMDVKIEWKGACKSCDMSAMTLRAGIEQAIRHKYPEIGKVVAVNGL